METLFLIMNSIGIFASGFVLGMAANYYFRR